MQIFVIIPALNEADCINGVVREALQQKVTRVIVVDNGSTDTTAQEAHAAGALVISETRRGYGYACAAGVRAAREADVLVFMDADGSFVASEMALLIEPIQQARADLVLGSRALESFASGVMPPQQRFGNTLAAFLVRALYKIQISDLGPYRAVRRDVIEQLNMQEMTYGYPTEMIVKAARLGKRIVQVPVSYHARRAGESKVSGTLRGTVLAGFRILSVTLRHAFPASRPQRNPG